MVDSKRPGLLESLKLAGIGPRQILESINRLREIAARGEDGMAGSLLSRIFDTTNLPQNMLVDNTIRVTTDFLIFQVSNFLILFFLIR